MTRSTREAVESPVEQGADEKIAYTFDFAGLGTSAPTSPTCQLWDVTDGTAWVDVTSTSLSGSATASGAIVTSGLVQALTAGHVYRLEAKASGAGGAVFEGYTMIYGAR